MIRLRAENATNRHGRSVTVEGTLGAVKERRWAARRAPDPVGRRAWSISFHRDGRPVGDFHEAWAGACIGAGRGRHGDEASRSAVPRSAALRPCATWSGLASPSAWRCR